MAQSIVDPENPKTALSVRAMLTANIGALECLPDTGKPFSIREWVADDEEGGFLFLTSRGDQHASLRGLISTWLEIAVNTMLSLEQDDQRRIWVVLDELPTLHQVPSLQPGLAESRQFGGCFCARHSGHLGPARPVRPQRRPKPSPACAAPGSCWPLRTVTPPNGPPTVWGRGEVEEMSEGFFLRGKHDKRWHFIDPQTRVAAPDPGLGDHAARKSPGLAPLPRPPTGRPNKAPVGETAQGGGAVSWGGGKTNRRTFWRKTRRTGKNGNTDAESDLGVLPDFEADIPSAPPEDDFDPQIPLALPPECGAGLPDGESSELGNRFQKKQGRSAAGVERADRGEMDVHGENRARAPQQRKSESEAEGRGTSKSRAGDAAMESPGGEEEETSPGSSANRATTAGVASEPKRPRQGWA